MKQVIVSLLLSSVASAATAGAFEQPQVYQLKPKDRVVIMGDSTTVDGVQAAGYVRLVDQAQREQIPDQGIAVSAKCKNGRTTGTLLGAGGWVTEMKESLGKPDFPTVVIINLGLNDSKSGEKGVAPFTGNLRQAVALLREMKVTAILCSPTTWGGLTQTKPYAEAARAVAAEMKCPLIDLYAVHADHIVKNTKDGKLLPGTNPTRDGTHLSGVGETLSAGAILRAFGLKPVWQKYQLRVTMSGGGKGKIKVEPEQPSYAPGTKVTLTAEPEAGYTCHGWKIDVEETTPKLTVTLDRHMVIVADIRPSEQKK